MDCTLEVWARGKNVRIIRLFKDGSCMRMWTNRREGYDFVELVGKYGFIGSVQTVLSGGNSTDRWEKQPLDMDKAQAIIDHFRNSARTARFTRVGRYQERMGQYTDVRLEEGPFKEAQEQFLSWLARK